MSIDVDRLARALEASEAEWRGCGSGDYMARVIARAYEAVVTRYDPSTVCARYWGSDGTLCSTHHGRFKDNAAKCSAQGKK